MRVRKFRSTAAAVTIVATALVACETGFAQRPVVLPSADAPVAMTSGGTEFQVALVTSGLIGPWDVALLPEPGSMLVSESRGALRLIRGGRLLAEPVWRSPSPNGIDVLHGVAVHPDFAENGLVYAAWLKGDDDRQTLAISRGRLAGDRLVEVEEIFVADAWEDAVMGLAGRMLFGPDATLYVTVGDRDRLVLSDDASVRLLAQRLDNHLGKTLRIRDDGSVPADNPFVDDTSARPEIFSFGHRNGYGLDFHPTTGELWQVEIGPMGGDEINILVPGGNYGWPLVSVGRNYSGAPVSDQPWFREGMIMPRMVWVPSISPSSLMFYRGDLFPQWKGELFVTALNGMEVQRIGFGKPGQAEPRVSMLGELGLRYRDIEQDSAGYIYLATELRYGSSEPEGAILRLEPVQ